MPGARSGVTPREALEIIGRQAPGAVLVFEGPQGAGKSWLLAEAAGPDDVVVRGRAAEATAELLAAAPLLGGGADPSDLAGQLEAARATLGTDGRLFVDDAHHLDAATARLVGAIAARADDWDVRVVVAARPGRAPADLPATAQPLAPFSTDDGPASFDHPGPIENFGELVAATGGRPGLLAAAAAGRLDQEVAALVTSADPASATVAQWLAWGGSTHDRDLLDPPFEVADLDEAVARIEELALIDADHAMPVGVAAAVRRATPPARRRELVGALTGVDPNVLADWLMAAGDDQSDLAREVFLGAARGAETEPDAAAELFARAEAIQPLEAADQGRWARALLLAGRPDDALDAARVAADRGDAAPDAVAVAAAAHARAERLADGAALLTTLAAADPEHPHLALRAWYRAALGEPVDQDDGGRRLGSDAVAARFAAAAATWLVEGTEAALDDLAQAAQAAADLPDTATWPQHPLATLATAASISRDGDMAAHATEQLVATDGHTDLATLRQRFVAMRAGRLGDAGGEAVTATAPRDQSLALALELGLALRQQVGDDLEAELERPRLLLTRIQADLWATDVLCELALVSARVHSLDDANRLLGHLDNLVEAPTSPAAREVRWTRLIAAVMADDGDAVGAAIDDLLSTAPEGEVAAAMAAAAEAFRSSFAGTPEPDVIFDATERLKAIGLPFEASHLAAAAALRSTDEAATRELLARSRQLRGDRRRGATAATGDVDALSDREIDVARLVVQGRTHKEIGAELFISPKTVEHHVARIRRKLQATNRAEMMAAITAYLDLVA